MMKILSPFEVERIRADLAEDLQFSKLIKTYSSSYPEIKDYNTAQLWDSLNRNNSTLKEWKNPMLKDRLRMVVSMIKRSNVNILNIGIGSANLENIYFSQKNKFKWYGIDISPASVKNAVKKYPKGRFEVGNINSINSKKNSFDYVIALEVLEHIRPVFTFKALGEVYRVLKPGGEAIVSVPLNEGLEYLVSKGKNTNAHVRVYTSSLIKAELSIVGFKIIKEKKLYAFNKFYNIKSIISKYVFPGIRQANNVIILVRKP